LFLPPLGEPVALELLPVLDRLTFPAELFLEAAPEVDLTAGLLCFCCDEPLTEALFCLAGALPLTALLLCLEGLEPLMEALLLLPDFVLLPTLPLLLLIAGVLSLF
jgi:hypothetical protein